MASEIETSANIAQDGFDDYYAEKLWNWIPGFYREEDANTPTAGTLRALIESMGGQSADLRRTIDRIWENYSVELADDDALEALGDIVATRMVHGLNRRARRVDVARTIYYRRRKGTPRVLESLITDITGWAGAHLETRKRLARSFHLLEPAPDLSLATFTKTPRGGWADLHSQRIPTLAWTPFEELSHTPDFRRLSGNEGRFGIAKVGVHLYRSRAFSLSYPTVVQIGPNPGVGEAWQYALDPSGRAVSLFQPADRPTADSWVRMREWQMPKALECRLLDHNEYEWTKETLATLASPGPLDAGTITLLEKYADRRVPNLRDLERLVASFPVAEKDDIELDMVAFMQATLVEDCGRKQLYGDNQALTLAIGDDNLTATDIAREELQVGNLGDWGASWDFTVVFDATKPDSKLVVDPTRGAVISQTTDATNPIIAPRLHYGFPGEVGAGTYDRRESIETVGVNSLDDGLGAPGPIDVLLTQPSGVDELQNSKTYKFKFAEHPALDAVEDYRLQASNFERPYLLYSEATGDPPALTTWTITAAAKVESTDLRCLVFDGLWIGLENTNAVVETLLDPDDPCTPVGGRLELAGIWDRVEINHCTLDPGGEQIRHQSDECMAVQYVTLEISGYVEELIIDRSIIGPILGTNGSLDACSIGKLTIRDSIVMSTDSTVTEAIDVKLGEVHIERSTIIGGVTANRLYATDSVIAGAGTITDRQNGCFRFSAGVQSNWPRPYESYIITQFERAWVDSATFGHPELVRFTELAPAEILTGAENHCVMGVWNHLFDEIKRADLRAKLDEFMPFDLLTQLVTDN